MNAYSAFYKQNFGSFQATYKNRNETNAMLAKKWSEMHELEKKVQYVQRENWHYPSLYDQ